MFLESIPEHSCRILDLGESELRVTQVHTVVGQHGVLGLTLGIRLGTHQQLDTGKQQQHHSVTKLVQTDDTSSHAEAEYSPESG